MARLATFMMTLGLASVACASLSTTSPGLTTAAPSPTQVSVSPTDVSIPAPAGWSLYRSQDLGFGFAYPAAAVLTSGEGETLATMAFPPDPSTNVVEETVTVSATNAAQICASPLAEGWPPGELAPESLVMNGTTFVRQTHSGVAAGTSTTWVAFTTSRAERCVSLDYTISTYDPANLDPTRFPTPPVRVDVQSKVRGFEALVATFTWLR